MDKVTFAKFVEDFEDVFEGKTSKEIATASGVTEEAVKAIRGGQHPAGIGELTKIAAAYDLEAATLKRWVKLIGDAASEVLKDTKKKAPAKPRERVPSASPSQARNNW